MFQKRFCALGIIVEIDFFLQDVPVTGLSDVGIGAGDQPQRVIVEAAADIGISFFGQRLILVVCAAVFLLGSGNIQDPLSGSFRDHVHESQQVLAGISEAHASADA